MKARVRKWTAAKRDLVEHFVYLAEESNIGTADRFLAAAEESFKELLRMPQLGSVRHVGNPRLAGVRMWPVRGFESYLIFYKPVKDGLEIIRIIHGSRDLDVLFR